MFETLERKSSPPLWLMRQAGRYLPEYRALREKVPDFMQFCWDPDLATEATLQPLRRFSLDAAIVFSDILVVPEALGQKVRFEPNVGPVLEPFSSSLFEICEDQIFEKIKKLSPIFQTVSQVRQQLDKKKSLVGFAGGPWTLATYMLEEGKTTSLSPFQKTLSYASKNPAQFQALLSLLSQFVALFLIEKLRAGVDVLQIFDTWAGVVPEEKRESFIQKPLFQIVELVRRAFPKTPILYFSRGLGGYYPSLLKAIPNLSFSLDETVDPLWAKKNLQENTLVQGNLDPLLLLKGGGEMEKRTLEILEVFSGGPFIFNLGHGVLPQTPLSHVERLVELVKNK